MSVKKYRKKPVVIEAIQLTKELALASLDCKEPGPFGLHVYGSWNTKTRTVSSAYVTIIIKKGFSQNCVRANLGDYIIRNSDGELSLCKPDIFESIYEEEPQC